MELGGRGTKPFLHGTVGAPGVDTGPAGRAGEPRHAAPAPRPKLGGCANASQSCRETAVSGCARSAAPPHAPARRRLSSAPIPPSKRPQRPVEMPLTQPRPPRSSPAGVAIAGDVGSAFQRAGLPAHARDRRGRARTTGLSKDRRSVAENEVPVVPRAALVPPPLRPVGGSGLTARAGGVWSCPPTVRGRGGRAPRARREVDIHFHRIFC